MRGNAASFLAAFLADREAACANEGMSSFKVACSAIAE